MANSPIFQVKANADGLFVSVNGAEFKAMPEESGIYPSIFHGEYALGIHTIGGVTEIWVNEPTGVPGATRLQQGLVMEDRPHGNVEVCWSYDGSHNNLDHSPHPGAIAEFQQVPQMRALHFRKGGEGEFTINCKTRLDNGYFVQVMDAFIGHLPGMDFAVQKHGITIGYSNLVKLLMVGRLIVRVMDRN